MDCTLSSVRNAFVEGAHAPTRIPHSSESASVYKPSDLSPLTGNCPQCRSIEQRIDLIEEKILDCQADCRDANDLRFRLRMLEEEHNQTTDLLAVAMREISSLQDKFELIFSRMKHFEDRTTLQQAEFMTRTACVDYQCRVDAEISAIKNNIVNNERLAKETQALTQAMVESFTIARATPQSPSCSSHGYDVLYNTYVCLRPHCHLMR